VLAIPSSSSKLNSGKKPSVNEPRTASANSASLAFFWQAFPYLFLAALTAVFFWQLITPFEPSRAWLWEDFIYQNYPYRVFAATSLAMGHFPFWNPYVFGGQPFFADIQTAVLYPFNLVQALFATPESVSPYLVQFIEILHYLLAAIFTHRFRGPQTHYFAFGEFLFRLFALRMLFGTIFETSTTRQAARHVGFVV